MAGWFIHLCAVKSVNLMTYGVDNFTTIGLFYLMFAPLPIGSRSITSAKDGSSPINTWLAHVGVCCSYMFVLSIFLVA